MFQHAREGFIQSRNANKASLSLFSWSWCNPAAFCVSPPLRWLGRVALRVVRFLCSPCCWQVQPKPASSLHSTLRASPSPQHAPPIIKRQTHSSASPFSLFTSLHLRRDIAPSPRSLGLICFDSTHHESFIRSSSAHQAHTPLPHYIHFLLYTGNHSVPRSTTFISGTTERVTRLDPTGGLTVCLRIPVSDQPSPARLNPLTGTLILPQ